MTSVIALAFILVGQADKEQHLLMFFRNGDSLFKQLFVKLV